MAAVAVAAAAAGLLAALAGLEGCASVGAPRGGPPDTIPPVLVLVEPDSYSVVTDFRGNRGEVRFEFDEPLSERNILGAVMFYPFDLRPHVKKGKRDLRVRPRTGWVEDRIYHIRVEPVVQDFFNNRIEEIHYVISTGVPIPDNGVTGTVYDRLTGREHRDARIDVVHLPDTLRYGGLADTAGAFSVRALPVGDYLAIGYEDVNNNQRADEFDRSDTIRVRLDSAEVLTLEFQVFRHDTLGPILGQVALIDSLTIELGFVGYLDPDVPLGAANVEVFSVDDSLPVALDTVLHRWRYTMYSDSIRRVEQAIRDSVAAAEAAAADTMPADTAAAAAAEEPPAPRLPPPPPPPPPPGTEQEAPAEEPLALPDQRIYVLMEKPLAPGTYGVRAVRILNLSGLEGGGEASFEREQPEAESEAEPDDEERPPEPPPG